MEPTATENSTQLLEVTTAKYNAAARRVIKAICYLFTVIIGNCAVGILAFATPLANQLDNKSKLWFNIFVIILMAGVCCVPLLALGFACRGFRTIGAKLNEMEGNPRRPLIPMQNV